MIDDEIAEEDAPREPIIVKGVGRDKDDIRFLSVAFNRALNDNELRAFHKYVRKFSGFGRIS